MNLFITGAAGFVGRELIREAKANGHDVTAVDLVDISELGIQKADIRQETIIELIPDGADAVIHLAGLTRDPDCKDKAYECFDANVMATLNLIDAAQKRNVKQFIFASSEWVYDSFEEGKNKTEDDLIDVRQLDSEYAFSKYVSEQNLRQKYNHGFCDTTILRFGIIYGPRDKNWSAVEALFNRVKTEDSVEVGSLKTGRCFIHVQDIVNGIISSIGLKGFHTLNLQGERLVTLGEIINASQSILGKTVNVIEKNPGNISIRPVSGQHAQDVLGWKPRYTIEKGLQSLISERIGA